MAGDDLFKRYLEIGASVLGMSREKAEGIVRDLVASGEVARGQAAKAADWLVERGRAGTEELAELVRREVRQQVAALGLATLDDVAALQAQIDELKAAAPPDPPPPTKAAATTAAATKGTAAATKAAAKRTTAGKAAGATKSAGISRSASVRKRAAPPGGGTVPREG